MSDIAALKALVKRAYDDGFHKGNGMDPGCRPDDHGNFEDFWSDVDGGDLASALAALLDTAETPMPHLVPGGLVEFKEGDFVVVGMQRDRNQTSVELRDRESWERDNRYDPAWDQGGPRETTVMQQAQPAHPIPGIMDWARRQEQQRRPAECPRTGCVLLEGHIGHHEGSTTSEHDGKICGCDGPPHRWSRGWCPDSGPVLRNEQFRRP